MQTDIFHTGMGPAVRVTDAEGRRWEFALRYRPRTVMQRRACEKRAAQYVERLVAVGDTLTVVEVG